jgi:hypothetical protein
VIEEANGYESVFGRRVKGRKLGAATVGEQSDSVCSKAEAGQSLIGGDLEGSPEVRDGDAGTHEIVVHRECQPAVVVLR